MGEALLIPRGNVAVNNHGPFLLCCSSKPSSFLPPFNPFSTRLINRKTFLLYLLILHSWDKYQSCCSLSSHYSAAGYTFHKFINGLLLTSLASLTWAPAFTRRSTIAVWPSQHASINTEMSCNRDRMYEQCQDVNNAILNDQRTLGFSPYLLIQFTSAFWWRRRPTSSALFCLTDSHSSWFSSFWLFWSHMSLWNSLTTTNSIRHQTQPMSTQPYAVSGLSSHPTHHAEYISHSKYQPQLPLTVLPLFHSTSMLQQWHERRTFPYRSHWTVASQWTCSFLLCWPSWSQQNNYILILQQQRSSQDFEGQDTLGSGV